MRAISLWQPWATLVALGLKQFETRHWVTDYRGPLAIHAAKRWTKEQSHFTMQLLADPVVGYVLRQFGYAAPDKLPLGAVVCTVRLAKILNTEYVLATDQVGIIEQMLGNYSIGRKAWLLLDVKRLDPPVPAIGHQGFWEWEG